LKNKITLISFDHWNYDNHIIQVLKDKGFEANHINIGKYKHKNFAEKLKNTFSKIFLNKNPKIRKRQEYIIETLKKSGKQDQILVINPELIDLNYHLEIKKHTTKYIAYLYDSVARCPIENLLNGLFDEIYSFDNEDVKRFNFKKITNYIYLDKKKITSFKPKYDVFYLASFDNRLKIINKIEKELNQINVKFLFIIVGKKTLKKIIISIFKFKKSSIKYQRKRIKHNEIGKFYEQTTVIFDIVRDNQTGLSFRIFEAMAYQKKIITNNQTIMEYDFYNPNNILVIDFENVSFVPEFFMSPYQPIPDDIFNKYTLNTWVETVFEIK
jgi:hypothetical protein